MANSLMTVLVRSLPDEDLRRLADLAWRAPSRPHRRRALQAMDKLRSRCARQADQLLSQLSPSAVTSPAVGRFNSVTADMPSLTTAGSSRFLWVLAVGGQGAGTDVAAVSEYFRICDHWTTATHLADFFRAPDPTDAETGLGVALAPQWERTRRTHPTEVRFRWVASLVLRTAADILASGAQVGTLSQISSDAVDEALSYIAHWGKHWRAPDRALSAEAEQLLRFMAAPAGEGGQFGRLVTDRRIEAKPLTVVGGVIVPVALRESALGLDAAFFSSLLSNQGSIASEVFELTTGRVLDDVISGSSLIAQPAAVRVSSGNTGQLDFGLHDRNTLILGECKAYATPSETHTPINNFSDAATNISGQLVARREAVLRGIPLTYGTSGRKLALGEAPQVHGLGVVLTPFGGAVWNADVIPGAFDESAHVSIVPLHQLVIVAAAMDNCAELVEYLEFRDRLLRARIVALDEADIWMVWMSPQRNEHLKDIRQAGRSNGVAHLRPFATTTDVALAEPQPQDARSWRARLRDVLN